MSTDTPKHKTKLRKWLPRLALAIWAPMLVHICAVLISNSLVASPIPSLNDPKLGKAIQDMRRFDDLDQWIAIHIINTRSNCSESILSHLLKRDRVVGLKEKMVLIEQHPEWEAQAKSLNISVETLTEAELKSIYNISATPILIVADPIGRLRYVGAYSTQKQKLDFKDVALIHGAMQENPPESIPLYGCAVDKTMQVLRNPLGIKDFTKNL